MTARQMYATSSFNQTQRHDDTDVVGTRFEDVRERVLLRESESERSHANLAIAVRLLSLGMRPGSVNRVGVVPMRGATPPSRRAPTGR